MGKYFHHATLRNSLKLAWAKVKENGRSSPSAETQSQIAWFEKDADRNIRRIQARLHKHEFEFDPQKGVLKQKQSGNGKRGIVMASVHNRIVERSILDCLQEKCDFIRQVVEQPTSVGGVPHRSVPHGLAQIQSAFRDGKTWFARSDISGFFDHVPRDVVISKIAEHVDDSNFIDLLERATKVTLSNEAALGEDRRCFPSDSEGVAQGSPLSPLFGNILLLDFDRRFNSDGIVCVRFVDDFILLGESEKQIADAFQYAQSHLKELGLNCHNPYAKDANLEKSEYGQTKRGFHFLGYRIEPGLYQPSLAARKRILKAIDQHIQIGRRAINDCINEKNSFAHRQRYAQTLDLIDRSLKGWGNAFAYGNSTSTLQDLDNAIDEKLDSFRKWFARRICSLDARQRRRAGGICLLSDIKPKSLEELPFQVSGKRKSFRQSTRTLTVSTDGSAFTSGKRKGRDRGPGGWAYVVHETGEQATGAMANTTNNEMELMAVVQAIRNLPADKSIKIRTDSQYVEKTYNSRGVAKSNLALWTELREMATARAIKITYVKGHNGDEHNELADRLANEAAKQLEQQSLSKAIKIAQNQWGVANDPPNSL